MFEERIGGYRYVVDTIFGSILARLGAVAGIPSAMILFYNGLVFVGGPEKFAYSWFVAICH